MKPADRITLAEVAEHPWILAGGGLELVPRAQPFCETSIDKAVVRALEAYDLVPDEVVASLLGDKRDTNYATYCYVKENHKLKLRRRGGGLKRASSEDFKQTMIRRRETYHGQSPHHPRPSSPHLTPPAAVPEGQAVLGGTARPSPKPPRRPRPPSHHDGSKPPSVRHRRRVTMGHDPSAARHGSASTTRPVPPSSAEHRRVARSRLHGPEGERDEMPLSASPSRTLTLSRSPTEALGLARPLEAAGGESGVPPRLRSGFSRLKRSTSSQGSLSDLLRRGSQSPPQTVSTSPRGPADEPPGASQALGGRRRSSFSFGSTRPGSRGSSGGLSRTSSFEVSAGGLEAPLDSGGTTTATAATTLPSLPGLPRLPPVGGSSGAGGGYRSGLTLGGSSTEPSGLDALQQRRVRTLRFPFSKNMVSAKAADVLLDNLKEVLRDQAIDFVDDRLTHGLKCSLGPLRFDAEIVKIPRLENMHGIHFRRVKGDALEYKELCTRIISGMRL